MKNFFSILFISIYLVGSLQPSWVLIDFYWNRDDYTQKYCLNLDQGITQCRASCYLDNLLQERKEEPNTHISLLKKDKSVELSYLFLLDLSELLVQDRLYTTFYENNYFFEYSNLIFHPPKI